MVESDIKIYKLNYSGEFEEQESDDPLKLFTLYSILAIYSQKGRTMYIWVSKHAAHSLKLYIPQIRDLFSRKYPNLSILRNITVESGEEPFDFFKLFQFDKEKLEEHVFAQERIIEPINNEIKELKDKVEHFIKEEKYQEVIQASEKIIELSKKINDKALQIDQEELIRSIKERHELRSQFKEIKARAINTRDEFETLLAQNKIFEAHELINKFKVEIARNSIDMVGIPFIENLILKEENIWHAAKLDKDKLLKKISCLEEEFKHLFKIEDYSNCKKVLHEALEIINSISDKGLIEKWNTMNKNLIRMETEHEEKLASLNRQVSDLQEKVKNNLKKNHLTEVIANCKEILDLANKNQKPEIIKEYSSIMEDTKRELEETREIINSLNKEILTLKEKRNYKNGINKIDLMLEEIEGPDFIDQKKDLEKLKNDLINEREEYIKIKEELKVLEDKLSTCQENQMFKEALRICEKIINIYQDLGNEERVRKYHEIREDIKDHHDEAVEIVNSIINDIVQLKAKGKLNEALTKIDSIIEDIPPDEFPGENSRLTMIRDELVSKNEAIIKFNNQLKSLESELTKIQNENNLLEAVNICEKILQISREANKEDILKNYNKILQELNQKIDKKKEKIDSLFGEIPKLKETQKFKEIIKKIELLIPEIPEIIFSNQVEEFLKIKKETNYEIEKIKKFNKRIGELEEKIEKERKNKNLNMVKKFCDELISLSKENNKMALATKYNDLLKEINEEIKSEKIQDIKGNIEDLSIKGIESLNNSLFQESIIYFERIIDLLEKENE